MIIDREIIRCPIHGIPDCSVLLTGCQEPNRLARLEALCEVMHDAYEAAAAEQGWETQQRSRKPWADVPEANKATMRIAVAALVAVLDGAA